MFVKDLLPDLKKNHQGWEKRHVVANVGLFWQTGHDDGMEWGLDGCIQFLRTPADWTFRDCSSPPELLVSSSPCDKRFCGG